MELLTIEEVAAFLRVSRETAYRLAGSGQIPGRKIGRHWRFVREDIVTLLRTPRPERDPRPLE